MKKEGFATLAIHGDKSQAKRDSIIYAFKNSSKKILVATDVASRGLDIKDIKYVINFDFSMTIEDYIHRIGRTGRAVASGYSYTFFSDQDSVFACDLIKVLRKSKQNVPQNLLNIQNDYIKKKSKYKGYHNNQPFSRYNSSFLSKGTKFGSKDSKVKGGFFENNKFSEKKHFRSEKFT